MAHYTPLLTTSNQDVDEDFRDSDSYPTDGSLQQKTQNHAYSFGFWITALICGLSLLSSIVLNISIPSIQSFSVDRRNTTSLRKLTPYPNLEVATKLMRHKNMPALYFPGTMIRIDSKNPDKRYGEGSTVIVSSTDSMFYRWSVDHPPKTMCIIIAAVPSTSDLEAGKKSYSAEGQVSAIEIWNVTHNPASFHSINWNERPERVALLGTVNFTATVETLDSAVATDGKELRPPTPLFDCSGGFDLTVEVACDDCRLEFEQVFSSPPLGFDLQQMG